MKNTKYMVNYKLVDKIISLSAEVRFGIRPASIATPFAVNLTALASLVSLADSCYVLRLDVGINFDT